jgi:FKBP-type peptidyl-prolyl cis-trans isomerase
MSERATIGAFGALMLAVAASLRTSARDGASEVDRIDRHLPRPVDPASQVSVLTVKRGHGEAAHEGDVVQIRFGGEPPREVRVGWGDGIAGMRIGERRRFLRNERVAPGEPLSYEMELVSIGSSGADHDE